MHLIRKSNGEKQSLNPDILILMYKGIGLEFRRNNCNGKEDSRIIDTQVVTEIRSVDVFIGETVDSENVKDRALRHTNI